MKRVIIGNGKVSNIIRNPEDVILGHDKIEITDPGSVYRALHKECAPGTTVINTAAKISLEWCEQNKVDSYRVNTMGPLLIATACHRLGLKLVHISSGCIFDGNHVPFKEDTLPTPAAWYSRTKTWADDMIVNSDLRDYLILRPRQMISPIPNDTNMLTKFLKKKDLACIDEPNSVTCIEDFKEMMDHLISVNAQGIYNCANSGTVSPFEIATALKEIDPSLNVSKIEYREYLKSIAVKRVNTVQDITKLVASGYVPRSGKEALAWCIQHYGGK